MKEPDITDSGGPDFSLSLLSPQYWLTWLGLGLFFLITLLPHRWLDRLGSRLGQLAAEKNKKRRGIVRTNLRLCFADSSDADIERMVLQNFHAQFRSLMHYYLLWWRSPDSVDKRLSLRGFEQIEAIHQQGKQVIVLLAHNVGLDFAVAGISMRTPAVGIYKQIRNPVIEWLVARSRLRFSAASGSRLFTREAGMRPLIREVRSGKIMIYLADEDLGEKNSVFVPFFGVQKATLPLLGRLARSCDAVVLPCVCCYQADTGRYEVRLFAPLDSITGKDDLADSREMNKAMEQLVNYCPQQYLWALRYFQTRPPGEDSVYE